MAPSPLQVNEKRVSEKRCELLGLGFDRLLSIALELSVCLVHVWITKKLEPTVGRAAVARPGGHSAGASEKEKGPLRFHFSAASACGRHRIASGPSFQQAKVSGMAGPPDSTASEAQVSAASKAEGIRGQDR